MLPPKTLLLLSLLFALPQDAFAHTSTSPGAGRRVRASTTKSMQSKFRRNVPDTFPFCPDHSSRLSASMQAEGIAQQTCSMHKSPDSIPRKAVKSLFSLVKFNF
jgi:hypothetical protein